MGSGKGRADGRKNAILLRTNVVVCLVIVIGFVLTAFLGAQASYRTSLEQIEQVTRLAAEDAYHRIDAVLAKPVNISTTMANDRFLHDFLQQEQNRLDDASFEESLGSYLAAYRELYGYDSAFLVSSGTARYYSYHGLDRVLEPDDSENGWYYRLLDGERDCEVVVDNDQVAGAGDEITAFVNAVIRDGDGTVLGVVGVGIRIGDVQGLLKEYRASFDVNAFLVDDDGVVQASAEHNGHEGVGLDEIGRFDAEALGFVHGGGNVGASAGIWTEGGPDGSARAFVVTRYLPDLGWHLVTERDTGEIVDQVKLQTALIVAVIAAILAIALVVITRVIRRFNRRIVELTRTVEQERHTMFERATQPLFDNIYEFDITNNRPANRVTADYFEKLGIPRDSAFDQALRIVADTQIKEEFRQGYVDTFLPENVLAAFHAGTDTLSYDFMTTDGGDYYWMRITARIVAWESDGTVHMLMYRQNIDAEKRQEHRMLELVQTDEMTGMLTKTATQHHIEALLAANPDTAYAFFIFDIDRFKAINDRLGHAFGDAVIKGFSETIRIQFRKDDLVGRVGGDEFAAFVATPSPEWAARKAQALSIALSGTHREGRQECSVTASIGVALSGPDAGDFETLYRRADEALYASKDRGRNCFTVFGEGTQGG